MNIHARKYVWEGGGRINCILSGTLPTVVYAYITIKGPLTLALCIPSYEITHFILIAEIKYVLRLGWCNLDGFLNTNSTEYVHLVFDITPHLRVQLS